MKHKVIYKGSQHFILLYNAPEPPPVMASIYQDAMAMNKFNDQMKFAEKHALKIINPDVMFGHFELVVDEPVDLPAGINVTVKDQYTCFLEV